jgi:hypothetical protein
MALEILARISHTLINKKLALLTNIASNVPDPIKSKLLSSRNEIFALLIDMRPFLLQLNQSNLQIESYEFSGLELVDDEGSVYKNIGGWMDICAEFLCLQTSNPSVFIRLPYKALSNMMSFPHKDSLQVRYSLIPLDLL